MATKGEIRTAWAKVRECKMWAGEFLAKAADAAADDDCQSFAGYMAEANRLVLLAAKRTKEVRAMQAELVAA